MQLARGR